MSKTNQLLSVCKSVLNFAPSAWKISSCVNITSSVSIKGPTIFPSSLFHTSSVNCGHDYGKPPSYWAGLTPPQKPLWKYFKEPKNWPKYNDIVYPPQKPGDPPRPAEVMHYRSNIKYSQKKLWYLALMLRGMSVDEALKQCTFYARKGGHIVKEIIEEAQEMAIRDHNVEFKSNLWIANAFMGKAHTVKGFRKGARMRFGIVNYRYSHFFICLREGSPPVHYYPPPETGHQKLEQHIKSLRDRTIIRAL